VQCLIPQEKLNEYQDAFKKIAESTKVKDIDELVKNFIEAEERNFSLSKFVEELTTESENLDNEIAKVKAKIQEYKNQGLSQNNENKKMQKELEEKIQEKEREYEQNKIEYKNSLEKINNIKASIDEIFELVDNDTSKKYKEMSKTMGITHDNIMTYLGMIEEMINDMIKQYAHYLAENLKANNDVSPNDATIVTLNNILMVAPKTDYGSIKSKVDLPAEQQDQDDDKLGYEPLKFDQFQKLVENKYGSN
jgi:chromosome segregation ATPase